MGKLNLIVRYKSDYTRLDGRDVKPFSVEVSGDLVASELPRNHPDWINWGIDKMEEAGEILPYVKPSQPVLSDDELRITNRELAKVTRDLAIESPIVVHGVSWQVNVIKDEPRIRRAIEALDAVNVGPEFTIDWTLTDNSTRPTTSAELKNVLHSKALREQTIFVQYQQWQGTDMLTPFEIS